MATTSQLGSRRGGLDPLVPPLGLVAVAAALLTGALLDHGWGLTWWLLLGLAAGYAVSGSV